MCKSPLKGFQIGLTENRKPNYMVCSYHVDHIEKIHGKWVKQYDSFISSLASEYVKDFQEIPCGHCIECYLNYSQQWANRCMLELTDYEPCECWFLTLTYDDEHIMDINSDVFPGTLMKSDLQKFWKRLRQFVERECGEKSRIRYFACGEYGTNTFRPHYHAILYGFPYVNLKTIGRSKSGFPLFECETLSKIWGNGYVTVSPVTWETCAYTARYVMKKVDKSYDQSLYEKNNLEREFVAMSRRPGIGLSYYELNKSKIYEFDQIILSTANGGKIIHPPKYFDDKYELDNPEKYEEIKERRKEKAENARLERMCHTDKEYLEQLRTEAEHLQRRLKGLRRDKI